jgi:hypothetical protein
MAAKFTQLSVLVFQLFSPESDDMLAGAACLFPACTEILDLTAKLDATQSFAWYSTHYHMRMVLLAAFCVLRITRSKLRDVITSQRSGTVAVQSNQLCEKQIHATNGS